MVFPCHSLFVLQTNVKFAQDMSRLLKKLSLDKTVCEILHCVSNFTLCVKPYFTFQLENLHLAKYFYTARGCDDCEVCTVYMYFVKCKPTQAEF